MGIGFVILLHLIGIGIFSVIASILVGLPTCLLSSKKKRKQKVLAAVLSPLFGLYSFYFVGLLGAIAVSEIKGVDVGIGDSYYVPLIGNCELRFIDSPEYAYIENNGDQIIDDISEVGLVEHQIFGKTRGGEYFSYEMKRDELKKVDSIHELLVENSSGMLELIPVNEFYLNRRTEVAGFSWIVVGIIAAVSGVSIVYVLIRVILGFASPQQCI